MIPRILSAFLLLALWAAWPLHIPAQESDTPGLDRMIQQIESKFPFLEGYVVEVQGSQIILDLKQGQDIKPGDHLIVLRYGEEIIHPVTKKKMARKETDLGRAVVSEVRKDYSIARLDNPAMPVKKGDGVRSFFRKISILVAPVEAKPGSRVDTLGLALEIEARLNGHPRFQVPAFDLSLWMVENKVDRDALTRGETLLHLQKKVDADYLLLPEVTGLGQKAVLDYQLVSAVDGGVLTQSRLLTTVPEKPIEKPGAPPGKSPRGRGEVQTDFKPENQGPLEYLTKEEMPFEIVDMDVGDLNGDGRADYVFIDKERVRFYKLDKFQFRQIGLYKSRQPGARFLSVDVADINGNGVDEVFVTNSLGGRLQSFVLEFDRKTDKIRPIWDGENLYFRVVKPFKQKPRLLVQEPGYDRPFRPTIYEYGWKGNGYEELRKIALPHIPGRPLITLYGLTLGNVTPTKSPEVIFLDSDYHLRVYSSSGRLLVKSDDYYGHDPRVIDVALKEQISGMQNPDAEDAQPVNYRGRLVLTQAGKERYLLLPKNHRLGGSFIDKLTVVNNSSLVILGIDKQGLRRIQETRKQSGFLATYQVADSPDPRHRLVHVVNVTQEGQLGLGKKISTIYTYRW